MGIMKDEQVRNYDIRAKELSDQVTRSQHAIQEYASTQKNRLLLFGRGADQLKHAIESNNGWTEKPIGPLGAYIQVKDKSWQPVLETVLGGSLGSYMVVNERDERMLRGLMSKCGWYAILNFVYSCDCDCEIVPYKLI